MSIFRLLLSFGGLTLAFLWPMLVFGQVESFGQGVLIRAINDPRVYYLEDGKRRLIESPNMLESQFQFADVIVTSPIEVNSIPIGQAMQYREGSLLAHSGTVYVVSNGKRRPIASAETFLQKGYRWPNVVFVSQAELAAHPLDAVLNSQDKHPDGSLLRAPSGRVYRIKDGMKHYIPAPSIFEMRYKWDSLIFVEQEVLDLYPEAENELYPDGSLVANERGVFIISNKTRRPITSPAVFESYGFNWSQVRKITDYNLNSIPEGPAYNQPKPYRPEVLVRPANTNLMYVFNESGQLRYIPTPFILNHHSYHVPEIISLSWRAFSQYKILNSLLFKDGSLVSYGGTVYLINNGLKSPIANPQVFLGLGYTWDKIIPLRAYEVDQYPTGSVIAAFFADQFYPIQANDGDDLVINLNGKYETIKLIGIDSPAANSRDTRGQCYGQEAKNALTNLIKNRRIRLIPDPDKPDRDSLNRLLRYAELEDGQSIQEYLLKEGFVREYQYENQLYQRRAHYKILEQQAKNTQKGLWAANTCNGSL